MYDISRLGVFFTASPRHADVLLVTGVGSRGMAGPLRTTYEAMPDPRIVIAAGTDAVSGGLLSRSEATTGGVGATVPVDIWLAGLAAEPVRHHQCPADRGGQAGRRREGDAMSGLFGAGLILLALAAAADLAGWRNGPPYVLGAAGSACLALTGGFALAGRTVRLPVAGWLGQPVPGQQAADLSADRLSGLFLVMAFGAAALVSVAFASWAARPGHGDAARAGRQLRAGAGRGRGDRDRARTRSPCCSAGRG